MSSFFPGKNQYFSFLTCLSEFLDYFAPFLAAAVSQIFEESRKLRTNKKSREIDCFGGREKIGAKVCLLRRSLPFAGKLDCGKKLSWRLRSYKFKSLSLPLSLSLSLTSSRSLSFYHSYALFLSQWENHAEVVDLGAASFLSLSHFLKPATVRPLSNLV